MKRLLVFAAVAVVAALQLLFARRSDTGGDLPKGVTLLRGPINGVVIEKGGARLAVYGHPTNAKNKFERVLLTHHRRDVLWAARASAEIGADAVAPAAEQKLIEKPGEFWTAFTKKRFHDYAQQTTKVTAKPLPVKRWVKEGDVIKWRGLSFHVLETPGYTPGAVSYVLDTGGKRVVFTGDLIYGDGQLIDLYSLQDAIPEANIRGYHGYASRLAKLVPSLRKVAAVKPDLLVPARGPVITNPQQAIEKLIKRVQTVYKSYLSTNALNWYFKEKRMRICGERVLGKGADVELMSYSLHQKAPDWVWNFSTSRLLISKNGSAFLLDCWNQGVIDAVKKEMAKRGVKRLDGIFVTHCHDDHTDAVQKGAEQFDCPVYAMADYKDVLENPHAYHLPAMSSNPIKNIRAKKDGQTMKWQEFELTFRTYPGQMFHHGALLVKRKNEKPIFFVGDSFSPSGIDDYCLLNRNLVHEDGGYLRCLNILRKFKGNYWLVNEHIPYVFTFSNKELDYLEGRYRKRIAALRELFPWDDPNYGIDEQWAVFYPYGSTAAAGQKLDLEVRITNHSPERRTFTVTPHVPAGTKLIHNEAKITLASRQTGRVRMRVQTPRAAGNYLVTADVESEGMRFRRWVEAMITVK